MKGATRGGSASLGGGSGSATAGDIAASLGAGVDWVSRGRGSSGRGGALATSGSRRLNHRGRHRVVLSRRENDRGGCLGGDGGTVGDRDVAGSSKEHRALVDRVDRVTCNGERH
jgi:hypothetical protein